MRRVAIHRAGGYDELCIEEHTVPAPGPGEALVAVHAFGVNYADCCVRMGVYASAREYVGWPITPGFEFAGTLVALGPPAPDTPLSPRQRAHPLTVRPRVVAA